MHWEKSSSEFGVQSLEFRIRGLKPVPSERQPDDPRVVIPAKAGIQNDNAGFRIKSGMTTSALSSSGMTLVELLLVMGLIGIVAAMIVPRIDFSISTRASVDGAAYMIASDIRYVQECAMASRVSKSIRFPLNQNACTFPATVPPSDGLDPSGRLPEGVTISSATIQFTFNSLGEPTTSLAGVWSVTVSGGGVTRTITVVNYTGKVNIS